MVTLISLKSTLVSHFGSMIFKTASTAKGDRVLLLPLTIFEDKQVVTHLINVSLSLNETGVSKLFKISSDLSSAI